MPDFNNLIMSQIQIGDVDYDICDLEGRLKLKDLENTISTIQKMIGEQGTAYAIYDSDTNTLTFFRANETYTSSDTSATDIMGNTYTGTIYTGIEDYTTAPAPWDDIKADIEKIVIADNQYIAPKSCAGWFSDTSVEEFENISQLDFRRTTDLSYMFAGCTKLTTLPDLSEWDTSNVTNMEHMFEECVAANYKSIAKWNTSNVTNMSNMFNGSNFYSDSEPYLLDWDTSSVTDFSYMFANYEGSSMYKTSKFDTSAAQNMSGMFQNCPNMTRLSIGQNWDTSNVTNMDYMFNNCPELTLDCSSWNVDKVTSHIDFAKDSPDVIEPEWPVITYAYAVLDSEGTLTFFRSEDEYTAGTGKTVTDVERNSYTGQVYTGIEEYEGTSDNSAPWYNKSSSIKLAKIADNQVIAPINCTAWFRGCSNMTDFEGADRLDVSKVTSMNYMFRGCTNATFNPDLSNWDTSNVTDMEYMFYSCYGTAFNPDLSSWDTSNVTSMNSMFYDCYGAAFNPDLSNWDTSNVTNMSKMFYDCYGAAFNSDLSNWDTSNVTDMSSMFEYCRGTAFNPDLSSWDTSNVTNMNRMFKDCSGAAFNPNLSSWDTSSVTNMRGMFYGCYGTAFTNLDVSNWDISNVTNTYEMFSRCFNLTTIYTALDADWSANTNLTISNGMFYNCTKLKGGNNTAFNNSYQDKTYARVDKDGQPGYFTDVAEKKSAPLVSGRAFRTTLADLVGEEIVENEFGWFIDYPSDSLVEIRQELSKDTSGTLISDPNSSDPAVYLKFDSTTGVATIVSPSKILTLPEDCSGMFQECNYVTSFPDMNKWDTSNVTDMSNMFNGCCDDAFNFDANNWDTSNVTNMSNMFYNCFGAAFNPDVSNWDTSNVTDMSYMFYNCPSAVFNPNISNWDTSNVTDMNSMFSSCNGEAFNPDVSNWNTSNVTNMREMFSGCYGAAFTNLNVNGWNISNVTDMTSMFSGCSNLTTIYTAPDANWAASVKLIESTNMFVDCIELKGGNNTAFNDSYIDKTYARVDEAGQPGYFTSTVAKSAPLVSGRAFRTALANLVGEEIHDADYQWWVDEPSKSLTEIRQEKSDDTSGTLISDPNSSDPAVYLKFDSTTGVATIVSSVEGIVLPEDCSGMFQDCKYATSLPNMNKWDASGVVNMSQMFASYGEEVAWTHDTSSEDWAIIFTGNYAAPPSIADWDVSNVEDAEVMFSTCGFQTPPDISNWNVSNMGGWFSECYAMTTAPTLPEGVTSLGYCFENCQSLATAPTIPNGVTNMENCFAECTSLTTASNIPSTVTNMNSCYQNCTSLTTIDTTNWDTSNVTYMDSVFMYSKSLVLDCSNWNVDNVVSHLDFAEGAPGVIEPNWPRSSNMLISDLGSKISELQYSFDNPNDITEIHFVAKDSTTGTLISEEGDSDPVYLNFDNNTGVVTITTAAPRFALNTDSSDLFSGYHINDMDQSTLTTITGTEKFDTSNVTNMSGMFGSCHNDAFVAPNMLNWDVSNVTDMSYMFNCCSGAAFNPDLSNWNTSNVTNMSWMFQACSGAAFNPDLSNWNTSNVTDMSNMFEYCQGAAFNPDLDNWDMSNVTNMNYMFNECTNLTLDCSDWNVDNVTTHESFSTNTSGVIEPHWTTAYAVLNSAGTLTFFRSTNNYTAGTGQTVTDVKGNSYTGQVYTGIETYAGTNFNSAPWYSQASSIKLAKIADSQIIAPINCVGWFSGCSKMTAFEGVERLDTSNVTNMNNMFSSCSNAAFNPDLSGLDTSNVTAMHSMFSDCSGAAFNPNVSSWDTSNVTNMSNMFNACYGAAFNPDLSSWDTSSVTNMSNMFYNCRGAAFTSLDVSNWNISNVTNTTSMFGRCSDLTTIYAASDANWEASTTLTSSGSMFVSCTKLKGGNNTAYNSSHTDKTYARVDKAGQPGYFTAKS